MLMQGRPSHGSYSVIVYSTWAGTGARYELGSTKRGWSLFCKLYKHKLLDENINNNSVKWWWLAMVSYNINSYNFFIFVLIIRIICCLINTNTEIQLQRHVFWGPILDYSNCIIWPKISLWACYTRTNAWFILSEATVLQDT